MPKSLYSADEHVQPIELKSAQPIQNNKEIVEFLTKDYPDESSIDEDKYVNIHQLIQVRTLKKSLWTIKNLLTNTLLKPVKSRFYLIVMLKIMMQLRHDA